LYPLGSVEVRESMPPPPAEVAETEGSGRPASERLGDV
jgi:hypothetical protein